MLNEKFEDCRHQTSKLLVVLPAFNDTFAIRSSLPLIRQLLLLAVAAPRFAVADPLF